MTQAYTPGLRVSGFTKIEKERILPIKGKTTVNAGDVVKPQDVVATAQLPGNVHFEKIAQKIGVEPSEIEKYLLVKVGDEIKQGNVIAEKKSLFGLFKDRLRSPVDGVFESFSNITGQCVFRAHPTTINILAYIGGRIKEVIPEEGVIIESEGAMIQGIFGIGGERMGNIKCIASSHKEVGDMTKLTEDLKDLIIIAGAYIDYNYIKKCVELGIRGVITAGLDDNDLKGILGYEIGVAITGNENIPLSIIVTEGFGKIDMAEKTFTLLRSLEGKFCSINGATQIRAGVIRPEIVVTDVETSDQISSEEYFLKPGKGVRVIRNPYFGKIAKVVSLPNELQKLETEAMVRVVEVEFENGENAIIPRANVEIIEG